MPYPKHLGFQVFGASSCLASSFAGRLTRLCSKNRQRVPVLPILCKIALLVGAAPAFAKVPAWIEEDLALYRGAKSAHEYIKKSKVIHRSDRSALIERIPASAKLPPVSLAERPHLALTSGRLTLEITDVQKQIVTIDGNVLTVPPLTNMPEFMNLLAKHARKHAFLWNILPEAFADSDNIQTGCLSDWQNTLLWARDPAAVLEYTWVTAIALKIISQTAQKAVQPTCDHQIRELKMMLTKNNIALKEIECDSEISGADRSMTFWLPEFTEGKKLKTREFDLDYTRGLASEGSVGKGQDDEDEEDEDEGTAKASTVSLDDVEREVKKVYRLYNFGISSLKEAHDIKSVDGENKCVSHKKGSPEFEKIAREIEPFREVFAYVNNHGSCVLCARQLRAKLATKTPPKSLRRLAITLGHKEATLRENSESQK